MTISVVTPCYNGLPWLPLCAASIADQDGDDVQHIIQDAGSKDGTQAWAATWTKSQFISEPDQGMYDAVNRGLRKSSGDIVAYLNCDEQYLPGALAKVRQFFLTHPDVDVLFGETVIVRPDGSYICHRKTHQPTKGDIWVRMPVMTSSLFFRRSALVAQDLYFDTHWKDYGDLFWVINALKKGVRISLLHEYLSSFADTGENRNLLPQARREAAEKTGLTPPNVRRFRQLLLLRYKAQFILKGYLWPRPFSYSIYTRESPSQRREFIVNHPTALWKRELPVPAAVAGR